MVSGPSSIGAGIDTSRVHYRPDPGEPAARLSAPPSQTALLVTAQEQRNETRLRSRAIVSGEDILYSRVTFDVGVSISSPVYNAGLTTLVTRKDENGVLPNRTVQVQPTDEEKEPSLAVDENQEDEEKTQNADESTGTPEENDRSSKQELEQEASNLDTEDSRLNRNLTMANLKQKQALEDGKAIEFQQAQREEDSLEREQEEVDKKQRKIELERFEQKLKEFQDSSNQALEDSLSAAIGLLDVMFGFGRDESSSNQEPQPAKVG